MMRIGYLAAAVLGAVVLSLTGCGFKTDPVPPGNVVPKAVDDLRYSLDETGVTLSWTYPDETVQGDDLTEISTFDVYRAVVPLADLCETCPIPFSEPTQIPGGETGEAGKSKVGTYNTSLLRADHKYFFKIRARNSWWASSTDSNIVSFVFHIPPSVPTGFSAIGEDSRIVLSWDPVTTLIDGETVDSAISYQVFRSEGGKDFVPLGELSTTTRFIDRDVINGKTYFYKVQSMMRLEQHLISGGVSEIANAVPVDLSPPDSPTGVRATRTQGGIKVYWERPSDPSVKAHRIYRRVGGQGNAELIGEVSMPSSIYVDEAMAEELKVFYSVTAIDTGDPANESAPSKETSVR
jgi:hypothetical protein